MRTITFLVGLLCTATHVDAQSRVYTNQDLTPTPVTRWTRTVTPDELAGLQARQFRLPPAVPADGPRVVILRDTPRFDAFAPTRPLAEPWSMTTYVGRGSDGGRSGRSHGGQTPHTVAPGIHLRYP
jgi:hypothetical protein